MLKKNLIAIISMAVLIIIAVIIYFGKNNNTLNEKETDFALQDVSSVTSIKIKNNDSIFFLNKKEDYWYYNDKFKANSALISLCLRIISQIEIKSSLPAKVSLPLTEKIKKSGLDIEIFNNDNLLKHYYIWADLSIRNTYMMMAEKEIPYLVFLPSYEGNFTAVFQTGKNNWRDLTLIEYSPKQISYIKVMKPDNLEQSYQIIIEGGKVIVADVKYNKPVKYNQEALSAYFYSLRKLNAEKYIDDQSLLKKLSTVTPISEIEISDVKGILTDIKFYLKAKGQIAIGDKNKYDKNRCFAVLNEEQMFLCKYVNVDPVTRNMDFFIQK